MKGHKVIIKSNVYSFEGTALISTFHSDLPISSLDISFATVTVKPDATNGWILYSYVLSLLCGSHISYLCFVYV